MTMDISPDSNFTSGSVREQKPSSILMLSVLNILGAIWIILLPVITGEGVEAAVDSFGVLPSLLYLAFAILFLLLLGSAIGMLVGKRWGWWLGTINYAYAILRAANALALILRMAQLYQVTPFQETLRAEALTEYYIKYGGRAAFNFLILGHLFSADVLKFFGLAQHSRVKLFLIVIGVAIGITAMTYVASLL